MCTFTLIDFLEIEILSGLIQFFLLIPPLNEFHFSVERPTEKVHTHRESVSVRAGRIKKYHSRWYF